MASAVVVHLHNSAVPPLLLCTAQQQGQGQGQDSEDGDEGSEDGDEDGQQKHGASTRLNLILARAKAALGNSNIFTSPVAGAGAGGHHQRKLRTALEAQFVLMLFQALVSTELDLQVQKLPVFFICLSAGYHNAVYWLV